LNHGESRAGVFVLFGTFYRCLLLMLSVLVCGARVLAAQEPPYFVTYSHVMEEPGNLEIASQNLGAAPKNANPFYSQTVELEYGVTAWYTAEVYVQGQSTVNDSTVFTGFRFENRFRPLRSEHWINPVIYVEYEDHSQADKSFMEITDHQVISDQEISNDALRKSVERAMEMKLILSSNFNGFNVSENFIAEKNLTNEPWEFGYAVGGKSEGLHVLQAIFFGRGRAVWRAGDAVRLWVWGDIDLRGADIGVSGAASCGGDGRAGVWAER
jgi:hypothetical protein